MISPEEARRTIARCSQAESAQHPLVRLAAVAMARASDGKPLDIETLTQYLAGRAGLDVPAHRSAEGRRGQGRRHHERRLRRAPQGAAGAGDGQRGGGGHRRALRRPTGSTRSSARPGARVRRVVANPQDIHRYTAEFFALAKSVRAAQKAGGNSGAASFEQLVELGKSNKQLDANDQGVVQVVDWLWQYAFDQRASDIHLEPRREQGVIRFRIDGVLHPVYQMPMGVLNAMIARIKLLGPHGRGGEAPAAGRPHQDPQPARRRGGDAPVDAAHRLRREDGDADLRPRHRGEGPRRARLRAARRAALGSAGQAAARHHPGDRPDRLGQDHHALLDAQARWRPRRSTSARWRTRSR